jgi:prophage DNA circulation protein
MAITYTPGYAPGLISGESNPTTTSSNRGSLDPVTNPDELSQLLPVAISGSNGGTIISFPCVMFKHNQKKSLTIHKYPNQDSGRIENMGRDPAIFNVRAILTNNIYPGINENWVAGALFPSVNNTNAVFNSLISLLDSDTELTLVHPLNGNITVQVESYTYDLNPKGPRDGAYVDIVLIECISQFEPITQTLSNAVIATSAATKLANVFGYQGVNPPGMSLSQFFGKVNGLLRSALAYPSNTVAAINAAVIAPATNGFETTTSLLLTAPAYTTSSILTTMQQTKNTVLNSPIQYAVSYDKSVYNVMQCVLSSNNTASQNANQFINKQLTVSYNLEQYYISLNNSNYSQIIQYIREYIYQLQQLSTSLSQNLSSTNQSTTVKTYVNPVAMSWAQLSSYLNNDIGDLMQLNQGLIGDIWVPAFNTINYYQA